MAVKEGLLPETETSPAHDMHPYITLDIVRG